jgi:hypothetical protein
MLNDQNCRFRAFKKFRCGEAFQNFWDRGGGCGRWRLEYGSEQNKKDKNEKGIAVGIINFLRPVNMIGRSERSAK